MPLSSCEFSVIFKNTHMTEHLWTTAKEVTHIEKSIYQVHQEIVHGKTSI